MSFSFLSTTTALTRSCKRFARSQQGSATVMVGAALFVMVVAAGVATDMSRTSTLKSKMGNALDGATLAAAQASLSVPCNMTPQEWATQQGQDYFKANFPAASLGAGSFTPTFTLSKDGSSVVGSASTTMSAPFMQVMGADYVPVDACSMVHIPLNNDIGPSVTNTSPHVHGDITTGLYTLATGTDGKGGNSGTVGIAGNGFSHFLAGLSDTYLAIATPYNDGSTTSNIQNVWIGSGFSTPNDTVYPNYGPRLHINGSNDFNSDDVYFESVYDSRDVTEFRLSIGDNAENPFVQGGVGDAFVIGAADYTKGDAWTPRFTFTSNGLLGIGTQNPQAPLDIASNNTSNGPSLLIEQPSSSLGSPRIAFVDTSLGDVSSAPAWIEDNNKDMFRIFRQPNISTAGAAYFNIDNAGNVTIDSGWAALPDFNYDSGATPTNSGRRTLYVNSDENVSGLVTAKTLWVAGNPANTASADILAVGTHAELTATNDGQTVQIVCGNCRDGVGDIWADATGIHIQAGETGTTGSGHVEIQGAQGNIYASNSISTNSWQSPSDRRLKKDITPYAADGLSLVEHLKPVTFNWKNPLSDDMKRQQLGFIAQDVQAVVPQAVTEQADKEKTLAINYNTLVPVLTKAIQQQQDEIAELRKEVAELKAKH